MRYAIDPTALVGKRITRMELNGKPIEPAKQYTVAGWAPVSEEARDAGLEPIWDVTARWLRAQKTIKPRKLNLPKIEGITTDPGMAT
jgi:sulfur-oxidizing protein SoxB